MATARNPKQLRRERRTAGAALCLLLATGAGCPLGVTDPTARDAPATIANPLAQERAATQALPGVRIRFHDDDFYTLGNPRSDTNCAGDARIYRDPLSYAPFQATTLDPQESIKPAFIKNVGVDISDANYLGSDNKSYRCSYEDTVNAPPSSACSTFDRISVTGVHAASEVFGTGFYFFQDTFCVDSSPIASGDPSSNRVLAGGAYIDLDRTNLGANENLLLSVTFFPLGSKNDLPSGALVGQNESPSFRVNLVRTGLSESAIRSDIQPRYLRYFSAGYPKIVQSLAILAPPAGQPKEEQIVLPIAIDSTIDRIQIERYSGSAFLVEASLYRLGKR